MDPSKPPSDIGAPSKASSDIDCPKANSDIGISTQSMRQLDCKLKPETATCEFDCDIQQNCTAEENTEARSKSDLINSELVKAEIIAPVEATLRIEQARVTAKRGKLAHKANNLNALLYDSKTQNFPGNLQVGEGTNIEEKTSHVTLHPRKHRYSISERNKLHVAIQRYHSQYDNSTSINFANDVSVGIAKNHIEDITDKRSICQNSQSLRGIKSNSYEYRGRTISFDNELSANRSSKSVNCAKHYMKKHDHTSKQLTRLQTSINLDAIKSNIENMECKIKSTYNPKLSRSSYVCRDKYSKRVSSCSFQNSMTSRETKLWKSFEKSSLMSPQSLRLKHFKPLNLLEFPSYLPKLDRLNTTSYASSIENREFRNCPEQYAENNLYPPPLSTLQIFAISTKPLDIQIMPIESIPSNIDELPSLPIINYTENKLQERKLSILEPPPPGLINRQESNESWNRFLVQLNSILENRVGEFV